jgi:hypothetical protein
VAGGADEEHCEEAVHGSCDVDACESFPALPGGIGGDVGLDTLDLVVAKRHANPPPEQRGPDQLRRVAGRAFPDCTIRLCSHGTLGGHRAPRVNTPAFRLVDARGRYRSNVIWVDPQALRAWTAQDARRAVVESNGQ